MMFTRLSVVSAIALLAAATPGGSPTKTTTVTVTPCPTTTQPASQCNTGPVQCCDSVEQSNSVAGSALLALLGIVLQGVTVPLGLGCDPISVVGVGSGATCNAEPVCCENNTFKGLVNIGCSPVNLNL